MGHVHDIGRRAVIGSLVAAMVLVARRAPGDPPDQAVFYTPAAELVPWNAKPTGIMCLDNRDCTRPQFCAQTSPASERQVCWDPDRGTGSLIIRHCLPCHDANHVYGYDFSGGGETFQEDKFNASFFYKLVVAKTMPPWPPEVPHDMHPPFDRDWDDAGGGVPDGTRPRLSADFALKAGTLQIPKADRDQIERWMYEYPRVTPFETNADAWRAMFGPTVTSRPLPGSHWRLPVTNTQGSEYVTKAGIEFRPIVSSRWAAPPGGQADKPPKWWNEDVDNVGSVSNAAGQRVSPHVTCFLTPLDAPDGTRQANAVETVNDVPDIYRNFAVPKDACCVVQQSDGKCDPARRNLSVQDAIRQAKDVYPTIEPDKVKVAEFTANSAVAHHALIYSQRTDDPKRVMTVQNREQYGTPPGPTGCSFPGEGSPYCDRVSTPKNHQKRYWGADAPLGSLGFDPAGGLGAWGPGMIFPPLGAGLYKVLPPGDDIVVQVHYSVKVNAPPVPDIPEIAIYFVEQGDAGYGDTDRRCSAHSIALSVYKLSLRPRAVTKVTSCAYTLPVDVRVPGVGPHMHTRGLAMQAWFQQPNGDPTPFFRIWGWAGKTQQPAGAGPRIPGWDFNYQYRYLFDSPFVLKAGTKIWFEAWFRNRGDDVITFGEGTNDEMATLWVAVHACDSADWQSLTCSLATLPSGAGDAIVTLGGGR